MHRISGTFIFSLAVYDGGKCPLSQVELHLWITKNSLERAHDVLTIRLGDILVGN